MCLTAKNFGLQEENINISQPQGKATNSENGMGNGLPHKEKRDRETDVHKERERGREDEVFYEKG